MEIKAVLIISLLVLVLGVVIVSGIYYQNIVYKFGEVEITKSQLEQIIPEQEGQPFRLCDIDSKECVGLMLWNLNK